MIIPILLSAGLVILTAMTILWLLSLALKNAGIVDIFWGTGFVVIAWFVYFQLAPLYKTISALSTAQSFYRSIFLAALVTIWGLRLSTHIFIRNHGKPEDFRYAKWRADNGPRWWWFSFFQVFLLQGILMWIISTPVIAGQLPHYAGFPRALDFIGGIVWLIGFIFESIGDLQLARFKADPANKGKLLISGLWKYTRHPNYFGDAAQWWGFYLIACGAGAWWTIFSPLIMTYLLMRVSGVTLLEKTMSAKPGYEEYTRRTSAFFPRPPKR